MKKTILRAFSLMALLILMGMGVHAQQKTGKWSDDETWDDEPADNPGVWSAIVNQDKAFIRFGGLHWSSSSTFQLAELGTLPTGAVGTFTVKRDPGTVTFNGSFQDGHGHGTYVYVPDAGFKAYLAAQGFKDLNDQLMLHLFFTNINKEYLGYMKQNGYEGLTIGQLKDLAYQNVNQRVITGYLELFKKEGYGKVPVDQIIELRNHGVDPHFIEDMKKAGGKDVSLDQAIELRDHGVSVEFIRSLTEMGYKNISLDKAQELVDHGVSAEFIRGFQRLGFKDLTLDQAQELVDHGVDVRYVKKLQDKGMKNMSLNEYIRLRDAGM